MNLFQKAHLFGPIADGGFHIHHLIDVFEERFSQLLFQWLGTGNNLDSPIIVAAVSVIQATGANGLRILRQQSASSPIKTIPLSALQVKKFSITRDF